MGRRIVLLAVVGIALVLFLGGLVTWIVRSRDLADREASRNSLRVLGRFAEQYSQATAEKKPPPLLNSVPPGTVVRPDLPPERRLSWVVQMLPVVGSGGQNAGKLLAEIDLAQPWDGGKNVAAARTPVRVLLCPARPPAVAEGEPAVTQFVGIAGLGADAAALPPDSPRAGAFQYGTATPLTAFPDGLSNTLLFGQTNHALGPWIRGGPSTVRGLLDGKLLGDDRQFGGIHPGGTFFGFADGHVTYFHDTTDARILRALATRAGGAAENLNVTD